MTPAAARLTLMLACLATASGTQARGTPSAHANAGATTATAKRLPAPPHARTAHTATRQGTRHPTHPTAAHPARKTTRGAMHRPAHHAVAAAAGAAAGAAAAAKTAKAAAPTPPPTPPPADDKGTVTGLPLPRFASLRADDVNLRSGPGTRYPIQWVYHRRDLPVRIEREFDVWRLIEDMDGVKGWVNQATLIGSRGFVATAPLSLLRDGPARDATVLAAVRAGVVGRLLRCDAPPPGATPEPLAGPDGALAGAADSAPVGPPAAPGSTVDPQDTAAKPKTEAAKPPNVAPKSSAPVVTDLAGTDAVVAQAIAQAQAGAVHPPPADAQPGWCRVRIRDYTGWLPRDALYGVLQGEVIAPS